jgi:hypothetical protein
MTEESKGESKKKRELPDGVKVKRWKRYIQERLKRIPGELVALRGEKARTQSDKKRQIYLAERIRLVSEEKKQLAGERDRLKKPQAA